MKKTVCGFNQEKVLKLSKEKRIDCIDLVILSWFIDFYPLMKKTIITDKEYAWVNYAKVVVDLPIINLNKVAVYRRFKKLTELKILEHVHIKKGGSFSYYGFGNNFSKLK